jgi:O-antigen/teichoic acid export membrane protein
MTTSSPPTVRRVLRGTASLLAGSMGAKVMSVLLVSVAARQLGLNAVGMVFFAQATAHVLLKAADFGLFEVLARRAARSETQVGSFLAAVRTRALGLALGAVAFAVGMLLLLPEQAPILTGFFVAHGLFLVHELGRAMLVGHERFGLNAVLGLGSRVLGTIVAVAGMLLGAGLWGWLVGALVSEVVQSVAVLTYAVRAADGDAAEPEQPMLREGLPFWAILVLRLATAHVTTLLVTAWLGFEATSFFGIASRLVEGGLLFISSLSYAVFPTLARERRRLVSRREILVVSGLAVLTAGGIYATAELAVLVIVGAPAPVLTTVVRVLAPAVGLLALAQPIDVWLRAKNHERQLVWVSGAEAAASIGAVFLLVAPLGVVGAGLAMLLASGVRALGVTGVAWAAVRSEPTLKADT